MDARISNDQIACIWTLARKLGMDRDDVHAMAKVASLKDLSMAGAIQMIDLLKEMAGQEVNTVPRGKPTPAEMAKINFLMHQLGWDDERLRAFIEKRFHVSHPRFMTDKTARMVIEALKAMAAGGRGERKEAKP